MLQDEAAQKLFFEKLAESVGSRDAWIKSMEVEHSNAPPFVVGGMGCGMTSGFITLSIHLTDIGIISLLDEPKVEAPPDDTKFSFSKTATRGGK